MSGDKPEPKDHDASFHDDTSEVRVITSFEDMTLHQNVLRGIYSYGCEKPFAIQQRAIAPFIRGGDIIAQAQFGAGKTVAFSIGLLQRVDFRHRNLQALVLSPTREHAERTHSVISKVGEYMSDVEGFVHTFVGKTHVQEELNLQAGIIVAVGTPGRISDEIKRGAMRTDSLRVLILDKADEMLSEGYCDQICDIFKCLPKDIQVALFSATMPEDVLELAKKLMRNPTRILVNHTLEGVKQFFVAVEEEGKMDMLMYICDTVLLGRSVFFANTRRKVDYIAEKLIHHNHAVSSIHAEMPRDQREKFISTFCNYNSRVLVATDLVARSIYTHVDLVINIDLPINSEDYLPRICFGGRYRSNVDVINFVARRDVKVLKEIEKRYHIEIKELPPDIASCLGKCFDTSEESICSF
jgi:translation initiation factor 4A